MSRIKRIFLKLINKIKHERFCKLKGYRCPDCIYHEWIWKGVEFMGNNCRYGRKMRCDKCGKRFEDDWQPSESWPKYDITQRCGLMSHTSKIYLCAECSKKFKKWLEAENESNSNR